MPSSGAEATPEPGPASASRSARWLWALLLVASIHLLTTAGAWYVTDHAEYLFVARRLLDHGTFDLAPAGVRRVEMLPWLVPGDGETLRTRLLPATPLTLVPLLAVDRAFGLEDPRQFGRIVHLQGHLFVLAGLFLLGRTVRRLGGSDAAAASAVLLAGVCWPVWLVARRIGPEPMLFFLVCAFLAAAPRAEAGPRKAAAGLRPAVCAFLPLVHPTGTVIGLTLLAAGFVDAWLDDGAQVGDRVRSLAWAVGGLALGLAGVVLCWNGLYHGDWYRGGYGPYATAPFFGVREPLAGLMLHLRALALEGGVVLTVAFAGMRVAGRPRAFGLTSALGLTTALLLLFATFYQPEPARRLVVVWPCWALIVGRTWDRLRLRGPAAQALLAAAFLVGFYWLIWNEGRHHPGPGGLFYPNILWVKLLVAGAPAWRLFPVAVLSLLLFVSAARTSGLLRLPASTGQA
jgi:hypothetical protein